MNRVRLAPIAAFGLLMALVLAGLATATEATPSHGPARAAAARILVTAGMPAADDGFTDIEDEFHSRRAIARAGHAARRVAASPTPLLTPAGSIRSARSVRADFVPPPDGSLARRAVEVFTIRGPPLG